MQSKESGFYYLQSRYYDPSIGRFINVDERITLNEFCGINLFVYCYNSPILIIDITGESGQTIELGHGWFYRIDPANSNTSTQKHIHIWTDGKSYAQNDDGSPHDKNNNSSGKLPRWVQKAVKSATGWDYNGKRESFFSHTTTIADDAGITYRFPDGTNIFRPYYSYSPYDFYRNGGTSVSYSESIYVNSGATNRVADQVYFAPVYPTGFIYPGGYMLPTTLFIPNPIIV